MNTEKIMEDIQSVQDNIREIKSTWGNTIMALDNIKSGLKADVQKKVDEAYQRGLDDAWEAAKELYLNGACKDLFGEYFNTFINNHTAWEAIAKLKAYEDKHSDRIEVGDEIKVYDNIGVVTYIYGHHVDVMMTNGSTCGWELEELEKTGKHYNIKGILEAMKS